MHLCYFCFDTSNVKNKTMDSVSLTAKTCEKTSVKRKADTENRPQIKSSVVYARRLRRSVKLITSNIISVHRTATLTAIIQNIQCCKHKLLLSLNMPVNTGTA